MKPCGVRLRLSKPGLWSKRGAQWTSPGHARLGPNGVGGGGQHTGRLAAKLQGDAADALVALCYGWGYLPWTMPWDAAVDPQGRVDLVFVDLVCAG